MVSRRKPVREKEDPWESLPDENMFDADFDHYADIETADAPAPRRRTRRRKSSRRDPLKVLLFLVMGMVGAGAVGGIGYALYQLIPSGGFPVFGNVVDLTYMPRKTEAFAWIDVDQVLNAPVVQPLLNSNPPLRRALTGAQSELQFSPEDIDSLTFGFWQPGRPSGLTGSPAGMPFGQPGGDTEYLMVLRAKVPMADSSFGPATVDQHNDTEFRTSGKSAVWFPDTYTAVFGNRDAVIAAIDQGDSQHRFEKFDFVDTGYDVIFAGVGPPNTMAPMSSPSPSMRRLQTSLQQSARGAALGIDVSSRIDANVQVWCRDSSQASSLAAEMSSSIEDGKAEVNSSRNNPMVLPFISHIDSVLNSLSVTQSGDTVRLTASIQKSTIDAIGQFAPMMR